MKDIQEMKRKARAAANKRAKENYRYARGFGFDAIESRILSNWSADRILSLAIEQGKVT